MLWTTLNPDPLMLLIGDVGMEGVEEWGKGRDDCDMMLGNLDPARGLIGLLCAISPHTWEPKHCV